MCECVYVCVLLERAASADECVCVFGARVIASSMGLCNGQCNGQCDGTLSDRLITKPYLVLLYYLSYSQYPTIYPSY